MSDTSDIKLVQRALGHDSVTTTLIYLHTVPDEVSDYIKSNWGVVDLIDLSEFSREFMPANYAD